MNFQEFLTKVENLKADKYDIKIHIAALANLLMAGAMDSMFDSPPDLKERFRLIELLKKAAGSQASLSNKQPKLDIHNINSEFNRQRWLKLTNPLFTFRMYDYYRSAILSMKNYQPMNRSGIVYIKETEENWNTWIFKSWNACTKSEVLKTIQNINTDHNQPIKIAVGFICILEKYVIKRNSDWGDICEVSFDDGQGLFTAVVWADRETKKTPTKMLAVIKELVGKPCIALGKLSMKNRVGMTLWQLQELLS